MIVETLLPSVLSPLVAGRVYPDVAPLSAALPRIVFQQVGGNAVNFTEGTAPDRESGRVQITVWAASRIDAALMSKQVEDRLLADATLQTYILGARIGIHEPDTGLRGSRQDFFLTWPR